MTNSTTDSITKVLFVCTGNICRSAMADGILRDKIKRENLPFSVDSAGTHGYHVGERYDPRTLATLRAHGIEAGDLRSRQLNEDDFTHFDIIFIADNANYQAITQRWGKTNADKTVPMTQFSKQYQGQAVPDPYYGDDEGFENVYNMLVDSIDGFLQSHKH